MRFIFTCQEACRELTIYEFGRFDATFTFVGWLDREVGLAETKLDQPSLAWLIRSTPIIFVRHIFAIDIVTAPENYTSILIELCKTSLVYGDCVSVQVRADAKPCIQPEGQAEQITTLLEKEGFASDLKEGDKILSVFIAENYIYAGLGDPVVNLSRWRGGMPYYSKSSEYGFISRAEYKLLEVFESLDISFTGVKIALDLGAAPGGWTKALVSRGISVICVDPCRLDPSLRMDKHIKYYPMTAERYQKLNTSDTYDLIVDDMKLAPELSLAIVKRFYNKLSPGGRSVITLKLEHGFCYKEILDCITKARPFAIEGARQLFHNRSEVTLVLRKLDVV
jgi:Predicted SAM-dependent methyltransferase